MILGICGVAGSGKDSVADILVAKHGFVKIGFADPLKRICMEVYNFTTEQLWGPSAARGRPDLRYPRKHGPWTPDLNCQCCGVPAHMGGTPCFLTPRFALQKLGTEWGRECFDPTWVDYALRVAYVTLQDQRRYDAVTGLAGGVDGLWRERKRGVVIPDTRFLNEASGIRSAAGKIVHITRPGAGLVGAAGQHVSETQQRDIPNDWFDAFLYNHGLLEELPQKVEALMEAMRRE